MLYFTYISKPKFLLKIGATHTLHIKREKRTDGLNHVSAEPFFPFYQWVAFFPDLLACFQHHVLSFPACPRPCFLFASLILWLEICESERWWMVLLVSQIKELQVSWVWAIVIVVERSNETMIIKPCAKFPPNKANWVSSTALPLSVL